MFVCKPVMCVNVSSMLAAVLFISVLVQPVYAQPTDRCPEVVTTVLETTETVCSSAGRNQACYVNSRSEAIPRPNVTDLAFDSAGDLADIASIARLELSALNVERGEWGVVLLRVQANLPDTLPGQYVTFLAFGEVSLEDRAEPVVQQVLTTRTGVNIRAQPTTTAGLLGSYGPGVSFIATGRHINSMGEAWVRVRYEADLVTTGWVSGVGVDSDFNTLPVVSAAAPVYEPMQAFYLRTGIGQRRCMDVPQDGVLIQTPSGLGRLTFNVNGVEMQLGSTAFLQAQPEGMLDVYLLTGGASLTAAGVTQSLRPGTFMQVTLDDDGNPVGAPSAPKPYDQAVIVPLLPLLTLLPEPIVSVPPPAQPGDDEDRNNDASGSAAPAVPAAPPDDDDDD